MGARSQIEHRAPLMLNAHARFLTLIGELIENTRGVPGQFHYALFTHHINKVRSIVAPRAFIVGRRHAEVAAFTRPTPRLVLFL